jgi:hypothetical protein
MIETQSKGSDKLTLDDLFSLKRAEVPEAGFWDQFDQEFRRKSLRAFTSSARQQRHSLWRGWGLGVCMASVLALSMPALLLLESKAPQQTTTLAYAEGNGYAVGENVALPWEALQVSDARFVIDTLETSTSAVDSPAMQLVSQPSGNFVMDTMTFEVPSGQRARSAVIF